MIFSEEVLRRAAEVLAREPGLRDAMTTPEAIAAIRRGRSSAEYFARACECHADRICLTSAAGTITYGDLWERASRVAGALSAGEHVGICGAPDIDWVVADLACLIAGAVSVPLATNLAAAELRALIEHADLARVICAASQRAAVCEVFAGPLDDVRDLETTPRAPARHGDLVTIMYSSGTTGRPKGVMLGEQRWRAHLDNALGWPPFPHVWIGYLPHSQIAGRRLVLEVMMHGGVTHFAHPLDDLARVRPTIVPLLPRVSAILYQQYQVAVAAGAQPAAAMASLRAGYATDRLCLVRVGSGSTPPDVLAFLARCFEVPVADGYGTTETGALAINGRLFDHVEYKLVDVPELGYAYPRGELLVRSIENTPGYYKDPEATAALFDADGFIRTGDVVEERAPRELVWLDRRANVTKLAQGQFVATSQLEELYASRSAVIDQIFLHANPRHAFLLAVVVPSREGDDVRRVIREDLDRIAREAGRPPHEVPRDFVIEREPFTVENELLTESGKQSTRRLRERYAPALDALHAAIEARQLSHAALADPTLDLASRVRAAVAVTLGLAVEDVTPELSFVGFGGDSLGALRLCKLVEDALGVTLPVARVLDRTASIASLADAIAKPGDFVAPDRAALARIVPDDAPVFPPAHVPPRTFQLTGATGFVGRALARALAASAHVICLVRDRAPEGFEAVHGDLLRPELGVDLRALAPRIDAIVHAGALVNHALSYRHMCAPNVVGTRELARLALLKPGVPFCFLSSVGVPMQHARDADSTEPGAGYVTSKWASEVLLEELHRRRGVPVSIVRCGNIAPRAGALNWADNTNRLLYSIVATGVAPTSFYAAPGGRYDLVPLDSAVAAITAIAMQTTGFAVHHVTSDDEVSLDTLVAWVESAGVPIRRVPYATWLAHLASLTDARSAFATLDRWRQPPPSPPPLDTATYRALRTSVVDEALVHRWVAALRR